MSAIPAGVGNRPLRSRITAGAPIAMAATGCIPTAVGTGTRTTPGVGRHSIMAGGTVLLIMAGSGRLIIRGVQAGSPGAGPARIVVGLLYRLTAMFDRESDL